MCCRRESVRMLLSLVYPFMMLTCLGANFQLEELNLFMSSNLFRIMIYKLLVLWMKHNAIRVPGFCNCRFEFSNLILKTFFSCFIDIWFNTWSFSWICTWKGRPHGTYRSMHCQLTWSRGITQVPSDM